MPNSQISLVKCFNPMKKYIAYTLLFSFSLLLFSCNKEAENRWNVEIKTTEPVKITDISAAFYNDKIPFQNFKKDFGFFLAPQVPDATYEKKRSDAIEKSVYKVQPIVFLNSLDYFYLEHLYRLFFRWHLHVFSRK